MIPLTSTSNEQSEIKDQQQNMAGDAGTVVLHGLQNRWQPTIFIQAAQTSPNRSANRSAKFDTCGGEWYN
jgi:hypothetical protein